MPTADSGQLIPGRDGQPAHLTIHVDLNDLRGPSVAGTVLDLRPRRGRPGSVYLTGAAAQAAACDAILTTVVTGQIDWQALDQLTSLWLTLHARGSPGQPGHRQTAALATATRPGGGHTPGGGHASDDSQPPGDSHEPGATPQGPLPGCPEPRAAALRALRSPAA